ncbi:MAG: XRE family transcriptional regulator [Clostridiales bacterium]|nr:XRE family transcriptional regulator [Clostridiales bacterium]
MNYRKLKLGTKNIIGRQVTIARKEKDMLQKDLLAKLQVEGLNISLSALSLLEGQKRPVCDYELFILAKVLDKDVNWLLNNGKEFKPNK